MRLTDLEPRFLRYGMDVTGHQIHRRVTDMSLAQGVSFLCPKCFVANGGPVGTHSILCWSKSRGVPDHAVPGPGRWTLEGSGLHDLTLGAEPGKSRSVLLEGGCRWHGFVTNGEVLDS